jgi:hypothetical protein
MISYSALTSYGKATLPSVEAWNGNFDIVRDPPSGIHTRRIVKVGDNNDLLGWNDDSGSRINEMINVYARGNNPMVSVQYSNHGNTGSGLMGVDGGTSGSNMNSLFSAGGGGKLPYRIMDKGAFRPPILRQEDLLPLSRMPRKCTSIASKRCRVDQTKTIKPDVVEYFKEIHKAPMKVSAQSQRSFKKEGPQEPPTNIDLMVNNNITSSVTSQRSFKKEGPQEPPTNIDLMVNNHTTVSSITSNTKKLRDTGNERSIPELQNTLLVSNVDHINEKRISQQKYIHDAPHLSKNVPSYEVQSASTLNIRPNKNYYELGGQTVKLTANRPFRGHSGLGVNSGGTMTKINQDKIISGVTLKKRM